MSVGRAARGGFVVVAAVVTALASSCQDPTQIVLQMHTDVPCADVRGTSLTVGPLDDVEVRPPTAITQACTEPERRIGSLVVVPSGATNDAVAVKTVLAFGRDLAECRPPDYGAGCIVARRSLKFVAGQTLTIPVFLSASCSGVICPDTQTCVGGSCTSATIDPGACASPDGCDESVLPVPGCATGRDCASHVCVAGKCVFARDCAALRTADASLPSGKYLVDLDGPGGLPAMTVDCDMATEGGGWTLVLEYLHRRGTNPDLRVRSSSLPVRSGRELGADDSANTASWGHAGNALMSAIAFDEVRWFARSSGHGRVIDFVTRSRAAIEYARTGRGTMRDEVYDPSVSRGLDGRVDATLPLHVARNAREGDANRGDLALTEYPFFGNSVIGNPRAHWGIRGRGARWEVDDFDLQSGGRADTQHEVWVRTSACADGVKNLGESDVDCGGACDRCAPGRACANSSDCLSGSCALGACEAGLQSSCKALLAAHPDLTSGVYAIDPDGAGPLPPLRAFCDMTFAGGGWTMVLSTSFGRAPNVSVAGAVLPGSTSHMRNGPLRALATGAAQVHLRTHASETTRSVTSVPGSGPIGRLTALGMLESGTSGPANLNAWRGPFADLLHLRFTCATTAGAWPSVYQACGTDGAHLWTGQGGHSRWQWLGGNRDLNEPMELYVR